MPTRNASGAKSRSLASQRTKDGASRGGQRNRMRPAQPWKLVAVQKPVALQLGALEASDLFKGFQLHGNQLVPIATFE